MAISEVVVLVRLDGVKKRKEFRYDDKTGMISIVAPGLGYLVVDFLLSLFIQALEKKTRSALLEIWTHCF